MRTRDIRVLPDCAKTIGFGWIINLVAQLVEQRWSLAEVKDFSFSSCGFISFLWLSQRRYHLGYLKPLRILEAPIFKWVFVRLFMLEFPRDPGATLRLGWGAPLVTQYWGDTRHFSLQFFIILKVLGGHVSPPPTPPPTPRSLFPLDSTKSTLTSKWP